KRVRAELKKDPTLATRHDPRTRWTALHVACSSRWHQIEPARTDGLATVAKLLLETGADPTGATPARPRGRGGWRPLRCVIAVSNSGADIEARDTTWNDIPLGWAAVGSGEQPRTNKEAHWTETVQTLLEHGASQVPGRGVTRRVFRLRRV